MASAIRIHLSIGGGPASPILMNALRQVVVQQKDEAPSGFQLHFQAGNRPAGEWDAMGALSAFDHVTIGVEIDGRVSTLMVGLITHIELSAQQGLPTVIATGEDLTFQMTRLEVSKPWPAMPDFLIATTVIGIYGAICGWSPSIHPTLRTVASNLSMVTQQQTVDDRCWVQTLAGRYGYTFAMKFGGSTPVAYWGPPDHGATPQKPLTYGPHPQRNVTSMSFTYDPTQPVQIFGMSEDPLDLGIPVPVIAMTTSSDLSPTFSSNPALGQSGTRKSLRYYPGNNPVQAYAEAMGEVDDSTKNVVTATGEVDGTLYRSALQAPGVVAIRGAGLSNDGLYYLKEVTHTLTTDSYRQSFTMTRGGLGTTIGSVA